MGNEGRWFAKDTLYMYIDGQAFSVRIHLGKVDGVIQCIGVDVRAFESDNDRGTDFRDATPIHPVLPPDDFEPSWGEVDTAVYRSVRLAHAVRTVTENVRAILAYSRHHAKTGERSMAYWSSQPPWDEDDASPMEKLMRDNPDRPKRGAPTRLTVEVLANVVAPAWLAGTGGRIESVRQALEDHWGELVTVDQAKKAISKARRNKPPLIPPANRKETR